MINLILTQGCIDKLTEIIAEETQSADKKMYLRIFVQGGGCSGFQYGFRLEEEPQEDDFLQDYSKTISLVVDVISAQYLQGATVDYFDENFESKFIIKNPNASSTCGCGSSFAI